MAAAKEEEEEEEEEEDSTTTEGGLGASPPRPPVLYYRFPEPHPFFHQRSSREPFVKIKCFNRARFPGARIASEGNSPKTLSPRYGCSLPLSLFT